MNWIRSFFVYPHKQTKDRSLMRDVERMLKESNNTRRMFLEIQKEQKQRAEARRQQSFSSLLK